MSEEVIKKINIEIVKHGHKLLANNATSDLRVREIHLYLKNRVEYPTDIGLLEDSL